jgi:D-3-phosphoglycerate dehydrogenase / 2-oxoglutarate reductase
MPWKVLISAPYLLPVIEEFRDFFDDNQIEIVIADVEERMEEAQLLPLVTDIDGVICGDDRITERVIAAAPKLKVIAKWGTGIDSIDSEAAQRRNIRVCRTPDAFTEPVADSVLGYVLSFARRLPWMSDAMKAGVWDKIPGRAIFETTIGVVGVGAVGSAVLRRAGAFGARLLGTDIHEIDAAHIQSLGVHMVSMDELLRDSDFISLNCDLNPTSRHLFAKAEFARMKRSAVVINAARGPVIDEVALVQALERGEIAGAALDVFEDEPLPSSSPLRGMDNVMLAPHNSNSSPASWQRVHESTLKQLLDGLKAAG